MFKKNFKKVMGILLTLAVVISGLPIGSMVAYADTVTDKNEDCTATYTLVRVDEESAKKGETYYAFNENYGGTIESNSSLIGKTFTEKEKNDLVARKGTKGTALTFKITGNGYRIGTHYEFNINEGGEVWYYVNDDTCGSGSNKKSINKDYWCRVYASYVGTSERDQLNMTLVKFVEKETIKHTWKETSRTPATCDDNGSVVYTCQNSGCEDTYVETLTKLGHNYQKTSTVPATCEEDGYIEYTCQNDSNHTYKDTLTKLGHDYGDWAYNSTTGKDERTCKRGGCGYVDSKTHEHDYSIHSGPTSAPTCTEKGHDWWSCVCGATTDKGVQDALDHQMGTWSYKNGEDTRVCVREGVSCTYSETKPHEHGRYTIIHHSEVEATLTTSGNIEYWECSACGKYFSDENCENEITDVVTNLDANVVNFLTGYNDLKTEWDKITHNNYNQFADDVVAVTALYDKIPKELQSRTDVQDALTNLKNMADKINGGKVSEVIDYINKLPSVESFNKGGENYYPDLKNNVKVQNDIVSVRNLYNSLDDSLKPLVTNYSTLTAVEKAFNDHKDAYNEALSIFDAIWGSVEEPNTGITDKVKATYDDFSNKSGIDSKLPSTAKLDAYEAEIAKIRNRISGNALVNEVVDYMAWGDDVEPALQKCESYITTMRDGIAKVNEFNSMVENLGTPAYTDEFKGKLDAAYEYYNAHFTDYLESTKYGSEFVKVSKAALDAAKAKYNELKAAKEFADYKEEQKTDLNNFVAPILDETNDAYDTEINLILSSALDNIGNAADKDTVDLTVANAKEAINQKLEKYRKEKADNEAAEKVETLINNIGTPVTLNSKENIEKAREEYDKLTDDQKKLVDNYKNLTDAEKTYKDLKDAKDKADKELANAKEKAIEAIQSRIDEIVEEIEKLDEVNDDVKATLVQEVEEMRDPSEATINEDETVDQVNTDKTNILNSLEEMLDAAKEKNVQAKKDREANELAKAKEDANKVIDELKYLSDEEKDNYKNEVNDKNKIDDVNKVVQDAKDKDEVNKEKAIDNLVDEIIKAIDNLGTPEYTNEFKNKLDAIDKLYEENLKDYNELRGEPCEDEFEKDITNLDKFNEAKAEYERLKKAAEDTPVNPPVVDPIVKDKDVQNVEDLINNIESPIDSNDKEAIEKAREAYDKLSDDQKKEVENYDALVRAEKEYEEAIANNPQSTITLNGGFKVSQTGSKINVTWGEVEGADYYKVYANYCGKTTSVKYKTKTTKTTYSFTKMNGKKLDLKKNYKVQVRAYTVVNGEEVCVSKTIIAHVVGVKNTKYTNPKGIKIGSSNVTLNVGGTSKIKATTIKVNSKKKLLGKTHASEFRYRSGDKNVCTVTNGTIKAKGAGSTYVYVYAKNGYCKTIKVTVLQDNEARYRF